MKLNNKIEKLRAVEITTDQINELIPNISILGDFSTSDKNLMENFKKIFHLGLRQLRKFIDLLNSSNADPYTVLYFTKQLLNGPLADEVQPLVDSNKSLWKKTPDILGTNGNVNRSQTSIPIFDSTTIPANANNVTLNKLPEFMRSNIEGIALIANTTTSVSVIKTLVVDNTLPCVEKNSSERVSGDESNLNSTAHGLYMVSDVSRFNVSEAAEQAIRSNVSGFNGSKDDALYLFKRDYNPYIDNDSEVDRYEVQRKLEYQYTNVNPDKPDDEIIIKNVIIKTDMYGNTYDSDEAKAYKMRVEDPEEENVEVELNLYTVKGRLGDVRAPEEEQQPEYTP